LERLAKAAVKQATAAPVVPKKDKKEKEKKEVAPVEEWVNTTPKGEKKGESIRSRLAQCNGPDIA
jgi:valyl-tRNA synthetase